MFRLEIYVSFPYFVSPFIAEANINNHEIQFPKSPMFTVRFVKSLVIYRQSFTLFVCSKTQREKEGVEGQKGFRLD